MIDIAVARVRVVDQIGVPARAGLIRMFVGVRVVMPAAVRVAVDVNRVGVVDVTIRVALIGVGIVKVILIAPHILVIAMVGVEMIRIRDVQVVVVRGGGVLVVVVAMAHVPVVAVFRVVLVDVIEMAGTGIIAVIGVAGGVGVVLVQLIVDVIGVPLVEVIVEREIAMDVAVIAMVGVGVSMTVDMRRRI